MSLCLDHPETPFPPLLFLCAPRSSFGEYNPGGGKEQVRKYLLLCKEQVEAAKGSLETIVKLLKL